MVKCLTLTLHILDDVLLDIANIGNPNIYSGLCDPDLYGQPAYSIVSLQSDSAVSCVCFIRLILCCKFFTLIFYLQ